MTRACRGAGSAAGIDDTDEVFVIAKNLEWKKKTKGDFRTPCYGVVACLVDEDDGDAQFTTSTTPSTA